MVAFAVKVYGRFSFNYSSRNADNLLVGWRYSAQALGFYKKAYDLFAFSASLLVSSIATVALSALSRFNKDSVQYKRHLLNAVKIIAFIGMGLGADLTLVGKDVIRLLLGPGWEPAGQIFTLFGPGIGIMLLYRTHGWIHLSSGRPDRWLRWGIVEFSVTCVLFLVALPWGPSGIAAAWTASFWILIIPAFWYAGKPIDLRVQSVVTAVWKYVVASIAAAGASAIITRSIPSFAFAAGSIWAAARILTISLLFAVLYIMAVILLHRSYAPIFQIARLIRETVPPLSSRWWLSNPPITEPSEALAMNTAREKT
jgi:PST family polysaccharide transporter